MRNPSQNLFLQHESHVDHPDCISEPSQREATWDVAGPTTDNDLLRDAVVQKVKKLHAFIKLLRSSPW